VLDDYHLVTNERIHQGVTYFLEGLPAHVSLVLATCADPLLTLARLQGRGQLTELSQADLRFTYDETASFLSSVFGLELSQDIVAGVEERTEGWIAGLQLAALSIRGQRVGSRGARGLHRAASRWVDALPLERVHASPRMCAT